MAGHGPAPAETRRRRNEPQRGDWVDLAPLGKPVLPELPDDAVDVWRPQTRATWEAWRRDPVTQCWSPADMAHALDTILLHNGLTAANASEIRIRMDGLGLTPKGKRDLRWRLPNDPAAPAAARRPARKTAGERRTRLSVVK